MNVEKTQMSSETLPTSVKSPAKNGVPKLNPKNGVLKLNPNPNTLSGNPHTNPHNPHGFTPHPHTNPHICIYPENSCGSHPQQQRALQQLRVELGHFALPTLMLKR